MADTLPQFLKRLLKKQNALVVYAVLTIGNLILSFVLPPNSATMAAYHLTRTQYHILTLLVYIPQAIIWFLAFYGYKTLQDYTSLIKKTDEGRSFYRMSLGLQWLAWSLPLSAMVSVVLYALVHNNVGFYTAAIIIEHYMAVIFAVVAFSLIGSGTHKLVGRQSVNTGRGIQFITLLFTICGVLFSFNTFNQVTGTTANPYRLPVWIILLTIVVPYLYAWYMGLFSVYEVLLYRRQAKGLLYKRALSLMAGGFVAIIASSIMIDLFTSNTKYLTRLNLNAVLLVVYVFLVITAGGYLLVALGTKRLKKIEEV